VIARLCGSGRQGRSISLLPTETLVLEIQGWGGVVVGLDDNLVDVLQTGSGRLSLIGMLSLICLVGCGCG
jgi:hypothetical protein